MPCIFRDFIQSSLNMVIQEVIITFNNYQRFVGSKDDEVRGMPATVKIRICILVSYLNR
jgi:hypothetical protein